MAKKVESHPLKLHNDVEAMGLVSLFSPFISRTSSSRVAMVNSQYPQAVVVRQADIPRILHGFEMQMAKHCFGAKAPCQMLVIDAIPKYFSRHGLTGIKQNPRVTVVYQDLDADKSTYDIMEIESHVRTHDTFGFKVQQTEASKRMTPGAVINKGTILTHSTNIKYDLMDEGMYGSGLMANVCYLSVPSTIEDGFLVSESFNARAQALSVGTRVAEWGKDKIPLNLYGDETNYKSYPDIGDRVRDDGIIMATRAVDPYMGAVNMTAKALMEVDVVHDDVIYAKPGAKVIDVNVISSNTEGRHQTTPEEVAEQPNYYAELQSQYCDKLIDVYNKINRQEPSSVKGPAFQRAVTAALADKPNHSSRNFKRARSEAIRRIYRGNPLDEFRVEIHFESDFELSLSSKITDLAGGKGVECSIVPDSHMPTDQFGNVADVVVYGRSAIARLNPSQLFEQYICASMRDVGSDVTRMVESGSKKAAWKFLVEFYEIASPPQAAICKKLSQKNKDIHLDNVCKNGIYLHLPADNDWIVGAEIYEKLQKFRPVNESPVKYIDHNGREQVTKTPVLIGGKYMIVLEKSDAKPMACAGSRLQHHGLPAVTNKNTRNSTPSKEQPPRVYGESEVRAIAATIGGDNLANILDYTTNPASHKQVVRSLFNAKNPSNIKSLVDRKEIPLGKNRPAAYVNHLLDCFGIEIL